MKRRGFLAAAGAGSLLRLAALPLPSAIALQHERANADERARAADFNPAELDIAALQQQLGRGLTSAALVTAYLSRIARIDHGGAGAAASSPKFRSVIAVNPLALDAARALDAERRSGSVRGPLHGIPILIKDNIATQDPLPTTAGSLALAKSLHRDDAPLVAKLRAAGAIILGKTNLSEWANFRSTLSISGWSAIGGQTGNAYDPARTPSGSSSGSATAAALSLCAAAIGTETDGSILSPSAVNGLVGFKPSVGAVSGVGIVPLSPRQDVAGPMARSVADAALIASVLYERPRRKESISTSMASRQDKLRIGIAPPSDSMRGDVAALYRRAIDVWRHTGAEIIDAPLPRSLRQAQSAEFTALLYEFKASLDAYLGALNAQQTSVHSLAALIEFNRRNADRELVRFGQEILEMAVTKGPLTDKAYLDALAELRKLVEFEGLDPMFRDLRVDVLVAPGAGPAALIDTILGDRNDTGGSTLGSAAAIAGLPSITLPIGVLKGQPVGMTVVAPRYAEDSLLRIATKFEREGNLRVPPKFARS